MNERYIFVIAAVFAELATSMTFYLTSPRNSLCLPFTNLSSYVDTHAGLGLLAWILVLGVTWLYDGPRIFRLHQNLSSKFRFLAKLALAGIAIDTAASLYSFQNSSTGSVPGDPASSLIAGLAERAILYSAAFLIPVLLAYLWTRNQKTIVTPPPRFGREQ